MSGRLTSIPLGDQHARLPAEGPGGAASVLPEGRPCSRGRSWISSTPALAHSSQLWSHPSQCSLPKMKRDSSSHLLWLWDRGPGLGIGLTFCRFADSWWKEGRGGSQGHGATSPQAQAGLPGLSGCRPRGGGSLSSGPLLGLLTPSVTHFFPGLFICSFTEAPASAGMGHRPCLVTTGLP